MNLLQDIKIIDFTRLLPGPKGTHILAQMGAKVIKIESPKRVDYARFSGTQIEGESTLFRQLNHNKTQLSIDYNTEKGRNQIYEMVKTADVVIEQFRPKAMDAWHLGYEDLKKINPKIVYVSLTGYAQNSKYANEAGHDLNYMAYSGVLSQNKNENGKPIIPAVQFADISGAYALVMAVQGAIIQQLKTGEGCNINVSIAKAVTPFLAIPYALHSGNLPNEESNIFNGKTFVNYAVYECADAGEWISFGAYELKFWNNFCELVEKPDWKTENLFDLSVHNFDKAAIEQLFKTKTRKQWTAFFKGHDVCFAPVLALEEIEKSDFHLENKTFESYETKNGHTLKNFALPFFVVD